ncbi:helix-turn-helix domain-containing protein [Pseudochrobactrum sp. MP213Fo]|uniref:helix-turn-helix domain-containing protein n=1 Tax=Pseudochrobactrum sp. MP213Fo TaxID=3022250 RepID=UPI003BA2A16E
MNIFPDILSEYSESLAVLHHLSASCRLSSLAAHMLYNPNNTSKLVGQAYDDAVFKACRCSQSHRVQQTILPRPLRPSCNIRKQNRVQERQNRAWLIGEALLLLVSTFFHVSIDELRGERRGSRQVARIRQLGMYIAHTMFGLTMAEVAHAFSRERTTVKHACHLIEDLRDDAGFDSSVSSFEYLIKTIYPFAGVHGDD